MRPSPPARPSGVLSVLMCCALFANCGGSSSSNSGNSPQAHGGGAKLTEIKIAPANKSIAKGTSLQFSATGTFSDGTQQGLSSSVQWQTSPPNVATITTQGDLTGITEGVAQVSATYQGLSASTSVTIGSPALVALAITPSQSSLPLDESEALTAIGKFSDRTTQDLSQLVGWQANPSNVASISAQGKLTGIGKGIVQISAAYQGLSASASVTIGSPALVAIAITPSQSSLPLDESEPLTAIGEFSDQTTQDLSQLVAWQVNPSTVASISAQGKLTGIGKGIAQISAAYQGLSAGASVVVGSAALVRIAVNLQQSSLPLGESEPATATGFFSDGTTQDVTLSVAWSSTWPAIASVSPSGAVAANGVGTATISASIASAIGTANLTVTPAAVVALNITPIGSLLFGNSVQLQAIATFSDGTTQDVTAIASWSSEQPGIIGVTRGGVATAEQVGTATVLAQSSGLSASAVITAMPLMTVSYFNRANAASAGVDGTLRLVNPGAPPRDMCAMIYVFDDSQEMNECCGCKISADGERTLSLLNDLTASTLTGKQLTVGTIEIVPSNPTPNGQCNPGSPTPNGLIPGWETNVQGATGNFQITEIPTAINPLSAGEAQTLTNACGMIQTLGSGSGICSCGSGG